MSRRNSGYFVSHPVKNMICAVVSAEESGFVFFKSIDDFVEKIDDNAVGIKIRGRDANERAKILSELFANVSVEGTAGKLYGLIKVRESGTGMESMFRKGYCSDEMSEAEVRDNSGL